MTALETLHPDLQRLCNELIKHRDFSILQGHRGKAEQDTAVANGYSKTPWPTSRHNSIPSLAVDMCPYPIPRWAMNPAGQAEDKMSRDYWVGWGAYVKGFADATGIPIRWGGDWDGDWDLLEHRLFDGPHFELRK